MVTPPGFQLGQLT